MPLNLLAFCIMLLLLFILPAVVFAQHPILLAGLHHDKALLLSSYQETLLDLDDALVPLIAPYNAALITTHLLDDARASTDKQLTDTVRALQKKLLTLTWLATELHDDAAHSQLSTRLLNSAKLRVDRVLTRAMQSHNKLTAFHAQVGLANTNLDASIQTLQSCYVDSMAFHSVLKNVRHQQRNQQYNLSTYDNVLLNLSYGHPIGAPLTKSTKRFTPFSPFVPSPVTGTVLAVHHFPGLGLGVVIAQSGYYTLVTGLESAEILHGAQVTAGTVLGKLHDQASDVMVVSWQKQAVE